MKLFTCAACRQLLFFENVQCARCGHVLAYLPDHGVLSALEAVPGADLHAALAPEARGARYRLCENYSRHAACNWAVPEADAERWCQACRLNQLIPDTSDPRLLDAWRQLEIAKRRLLYTVLGLGLPLTARSEGGQGLAFAFKQDTGDEKVFTGHSDGVITINVAEADAPFREKLREQLGEAYRTLLGHFRHEIGHYYWARLVQDTRWLEPFRSLFGDESDDYAKALERHYTDVPAPDWQTRFVSSYAAAHPWEDFAESVAHYLHMVDTLETARSHGLSLEPRPIGGAPVAPVKAHRLFFDDFEDLISDWFPITISLNNFNRGMGLPDLYPFVLSELAVAKLRFVHELVEDARGAGAPSAPTQPERSH